MSTTRNTKGQFARKTAPKKPVKKPTQLDRIERLLKATFDAQIIICERMNGQRDQIQRDIEQVRTLAHQTRTNSRANTVILNKTLAGVDLLKSGSSFMQEVEQHKSQPNFTVWDDWQPEEPKAEPWVPKENEWVVCDKAQSNASPGWAKPFMDDLIGTPMKVIGRDRAYAIRACGFLWADEWLRPATSEEIAAHERQEKLKKLVRGCRVETPDGEGIYLGQDSGSKDLCVVSRDTDAPQYAPFTYSLDQLTPLT